MQESKIAIFHIGTASSGKSTQTRENQKQFANYPQILVHEDDARRYFTTYPAVLRRPVHIYSIQEPIQNYKVYHLKKTFRKSGVRVGIFDGSLIDGPVLVDFYGDPSGGKQLWDDAKEALPKYTHYLLHDPRRVPFEHDGIRQESDEERLAIHQAYEKFLIMHDLPYTLIAGNLEERIHQISGQIDKLLEQEHIIFEPGSAVIT